MNRENLLPAIALTLVLGCLGLAIIDEQSRPSFYDLANIGLGGFVGWVAPRGQK